MLNHRFMHLLHRHHTKELMCFYISMLLMSTLTSGVPVLPRTPPRISPSTTQPTPTTTSIPPEVTTTMCDSNLGARIEICIYDFHHHWHRYITADHDQERRQQKDTMCSTYITALYCLHGILSDCTPSNAQLDVMGNRIGYLRDELAVLCLGQAPPSRTTAMTENSTTTSSSTVAIPSSSTVADASTKKTTTPSPHTPTPSPHTTMKTNNTTDNTTEQPESISGDSSDADATTTDVETSTSPEDLRGIRILATIEESSDTIDSEGNLVKDSEHTRDQGRYNAHLIAQVIKSDVHERNHNHVLAEMNKSLKTEKNNDISRSNVLALDIQFTYSRDGRQTSLLADLMPWNSVVNVQDNSAAQALERASEPRLYEEHPVAMPYVSSAVDSKQQSVWVVILTVLLSLVCWLR